MKGLETKLRRRSHTLARSSLPKTSSHLPFPFFTLFTVLSQFAVQPNHQICLCTGKDVFALELSFDPSRRQWVISGNPCYFSGEWAVQIKSTVPWHEQWSVGVYFPGGCCLARPSSPAQCCRRWLFHGLRWAIRSRPSRGKRYLEIRARSIPRCLRISQLLLSRPCRVKRYLLLMFLFRGTDGHSKLGTSSQLPLFGSASRRQISSVRHRCGRHGCLRVRQSMTIWVLHDKIVSAGNHHSATCHCHCAGV